MQFYNKKIVCSGDVYEVYEYEGTIVSGYTLTDHQKHSGRRGEAGECDKLQNRLRVQQKAKRELKRLINANAGRWPEKVKFLTLTFAENVTSLPRANAEWKKFRRRMEYKLGGKMQYVVVPEFQDRGAVHYHMICNLPIYKN